MKLWQFWEWFHFVYIAATHSSIIHVLLFLYGMTQWHRWQRCLIAWLVGGGTTNKQPPLASYIQLAPHSGSNICGIGWSVFVREVGRWLTRATVASSPWEPEPSLAAARRPAGCKVKGGSGSPNFRSMCLHPQPTKQPDFCLPSVSWSPQK